MNLLMNAERTNCLLVSVCVCWYHDPSFDRSFDKRCVGISHDRCPVCPSEPGAALIMPSRAGARSGRNDAVCVATATRDATFPTPFTLTLLLLLLLLYANETRDRFEHARRECALKARRASLEH